MLTSVWNHFWFCWK